MRQAAKVDRRFFLKQATAAFLSASALGNSPGIAQTLVPKRGGYAKFGIGDGSTTNTLDPRGHAETFTICAFDGGLSNSLMEVDARGEVVGDLAESWDATKDIKTWKFVLHPDLSFHNGKKVTAADVMDSLRFHSGPDSVSAMKSALSAISAMKPDGDRGIVFELSEPSADFPYLLSDYHLAVMPSLGDGKVDWESGVRTGPFILEDFQPGISTKLRRNPNYHKDGKPYFENVEFFCIVDAAARNNALLTGEIDYCDPVDLKVFERIKSTPGIMVNEVSGYSHFSLPMDVTAMPFNDPNVRLALKHAINREEIVEKILLGHAKIGNDNPISSGMKFATDPSPQHTYDPEKARSYLKRSGLEELSVDLHVAEAAFAGAVNAATLIKEQAKAAGIRINIVREPDDAYWDNVWLKKPWCFSNWSGRPTCDWMFTTAYAKDAAWNETHWSNPRFNALLAQGRGELDDKKRSEIYAEMQQLVHDDGGAIIFAFNNYVTANSSKLMHGEIAANHPGDGTKIAERWWMAE
ncbi:MAG: ABC transporter substrate-binding protein [Parvibaculaceae bacterium]